MMDGPRKAACPSQASASRRPLGARPGHPAARPRRAAVLGAVLTAAAAAGALTLAGATAGSWPGAGSVEPAAALLTVSLAIATALVGWVTTVLAVASLDLLHAARQAAAGRSTGLPTSPPRSGAVSTWAVRWVGAALVAATATPAAAAGPASVPEPSWVTVATMPAEAQQPGGAPEDLQGESAGGSGSAGGDGVQAASPEGQEAVLPDGSPVPLPGWTPAPAQPTHAASTLVGLVSATPQESGSAPVVVRRGDSLWAIAARHLGPGATVEDVAEEWPRWYAANRDLIGADPDLILPGQELIAPAHEVGR